MTLSSTPTSTVLWRNWAVGLLLAEQAESTVSSLVRFPLPAAWGIDLYLLDETQAPTGSLKHRLARSLFLAGLVDGTITADTTIVEASSGSTAVSEAYFAQMLGLRFIAVVPFGTSPEKISIIERFGGECHFVAGPALMTSESRAIAARTGGHYMDQFTNAVNVTDWLGESGMGATVFSLLAGERHPVPDWIVSGVGTGGTSASIGRYCRRHQYGTRVAMVDPENSAYFAAWVDDDPLATGTGSRIEGIGRPSVEPSFLPTVLDAAMRVSDEQSVAGIHLLEELTGIRAGGSTGTNLSGALELVAQLKAEGRTGSIVTLMCDAGDRYTNTYYSREWLELNGLDVEGPLAEMRSFLATGEWIPAPGRIDFRDRRRTAPQPTHSH